MKLVLANNQSEKFVNFYRDLQSRSEVPFDYAGYSALLFWFDGTNEPKLEVWHTGNGKQLADYEGVYINGYLPVYELAATVAVCCEHLGINYVNRELQNPPSLSKLSMHAKLAAGGISTPRSFGGTKQALMAAGDLLDRISFPAVLKRADADRGIDNFKLASREEVADTLSDYEDESIWILQEFVPNEGYYLVSFYDQKPVFSIFRTLEERPDHDEKKAHFYKPGGGINASLIAIDDLPPTLLQACQSALDTMNRQIGSVDCLYDPATDTPYILEVNYNPQLVTIETFKDVRQQAFLDGLHKI